MVDGANQAMDSPLMSCIDGVSPTLFFFFAAIVSVGWEHTSVTLPPPMLLPMRRVLQCGALTPTVGEPTGPRWAKPFASTAFRRALVATCA